MEIINHIKSTPAVISLTSWKGRINTVGITLFNLIKSCPGFHIVLVLSEEEFPLKETELPKDLLLLIKSGNVQLLWVGRNVKAFKKVLYTMRLYKSVPIISADDDCLYRYNYADELLTRWNTCRASRVSYYSTTYHNLTITGGYATLYAPNLFGVYTSILDDEQTASKIVENIEDDCLYAALAHKLAKNDVVSLNKPFESVAITHNETNPLHDHYRNDMWKVHTDNMWSIVSTMDVITSRN